MSKEAIQKGIDALRGVIAWDIMRNHLVPYRVRDPIHEAIEALAALAEQPAQQEPVECQYGKGGYACCEGGPCKADEQNNAPRPAQQQEPVAWATQLNEYAHIKWGAKRPEYPMVYESPLYTSPPASKPWVGLDHDDIHALMNEYFYEGMQPSAIHFANFARAIEAKLKEKNT